MPKRVFTLLIATTAALLVTAGLAFGAVPAHPKWKSSSLHATWNHAGFQFQNDMWNCPQAACGRQTIWANGVSDWGVASRMAAGNTAVLTYPDIGKLFGTAAGGKAAPVSSFTQLRNGFTESMPHIKGMHAEAADDVWLNDWKIEMMIWVDNAGRSLAGSKHLGSAVISGQHFSVWKYGSSEFIFDLNHNETSGQTHILTSIDWLMQHGYVPASATMTQAEFGWEIASTGGHTEDFRISHYWLQARTR